MVLGQVSRPGKAGESSAEAPTTQQQFTTPMNRDSPRSSPAFRVDPDGSNSSIVTVQTSLDATSRRRLRRHWLLIGPANSLIRRMALHLLADELRRSGLGTD